MGEATKQEGGGQVKLYTYKKGDRKSISHAEEEHNTFRGSLNTFSHTDGQGYKKCPPSKVRGQTKNDFLSYIHFML